MKLLKMKINRRAVDGATRYTYPTPYYDAKKVKFGPIYEGSCCAADAQAREADDEFILLGVDDEDAPGFLQANGYKKDGFTYEVTEVDKTTALASCDKWVEQSEKITDQSKVLSVLAKVAREESLTQEEKDSIDPAKPDLGISKTKSLTDMLDENEIL